MSSEPKIDSQQKAALLKLLESGNVPKCMQFFRGMSEKTRREYFPVVKPFWSEVRKNRFVEDTPGTFRWNALEDIACVAYFSTATGAEIIKAKRAGYPDPDVAFEIIDDRRPDWVDQWIESLLGESSFWLNWRLIRRLILAGLANKPTNPRYYLGMISGINSRRGKTPLIDELEKDSDLLKEDIWKLFEYDGDGENSLANTERFEKSWIEAFLLLISRGKLPRGRLLEATMDALERDFNHYRAKWFYEFFDRLEPTEKELRKYAERMLGLLGVSAPNVAAWALGRVETIAATSPLESSTLCHAMEPVLRARAKGTVLTALKMLERQAAACPKETPRISVTVTQALAHDSADVQKAAFKLLQTITSPQDKQVRDQIEMLQPTLAASVRSLVAQWLTSESQTKPSSKAQSAQSLPQTTSKTTGTKQPTARDASGNAAAFSRLSELPKQVQSLYALDQLQKHLTAKTLSIPAAIFDGTDIPRLLRIPRLTPIETLEELIDVCARVIEDGSLVDDAERCIDGLARLAKPKSADMDHMTAPLMKRIRKLVAKGATPFCGTDPANDIMGLFYAFCTQTIIAPKQQGRYLHIAFEGEDIREHDANTRKSIGFLSAHTLSVARRIASGEHWQLLSSPTHAGGWLDGCALAERANAWVGPDPHAHDVILALLRLAPDHRATALKALGNNSREWFQAIRYALGAENVQFGNQTAIWIAAARARAPWSDDDQAMKKFPGLGPDAAEAAKLLLTSKTRKSDSFKFCEPRFEIEPAVPKTTDPLFVTVTMFISPMMGNGLSFELGGFAGRTNGAVRWTATIWPVARESYFAGSILNCFSNLDWWEAMWQNRTMLEPLIDSGTPLRHAGLLFLCGMLAAKEPGESGLATDIAIRAIEDGRLGTDNLGNVLAHLLFTGLIKPGRWQKTLSEVARASAVHAAVIQVALQRCFEDPKREMPKDSSKLLELLYELSMELGLPVTSPLCRDWLASGAATGKGAKLAKNLLAIEDTPASIDSKVHVLEQAIVQRATAARRQTS